MQRMALFFPICFLFLLSVLTLCVYLEDSLESVLSLLVWLTIFRSTIISMDDEEKLVKNKQIVRF